MIDARTFPIERIIAARAITLRGKVERVGACPRCGGRDRFAINVRKQKWNCRGCHKGGDAIALVQFLDGCDFRQAIAILAGETSSIGIDRPPQRHAEREQSGADDYERRQRDKARYLWRASRPARGTLVEIYLRSRGITCPLPATLRYLPPSRPEHSPALIAAYAMPEEPEPGLLAITEDMITAVHLVLLKADGTGKAELEKPKITIASPAGMPIVIAPPNDLSGLSVTEGVEDALTVRAATGLGTWAAGGAPFMPKLAPAVPDYVEAVTIFAHADEAGQRDARRLADALAARCIEVRVEGLA